MTTKLLLADIAISVLRGMAVTYAVEQEHIVFAVVLHFAIGYANPFLTFPYPAGRSAKRGNTFFLGVSVMYLCMNGPSIIQAMFVLASILMCAATEFMPAPDHAGIAVYPLQVGAACHLLYEQRYFLALMNPLFMIPLPLTFAIEWANTLLRFAVLAFRTIWRRICFFAKHEWPSLGLFRWKLLSRLIQASTTDVHPEFELMPVQIDPRRIPVDLIHLIAVHLRVVFGADYVAREFALIPALLQRQQRIISPHFLRDIVDSWVLSRYRPDITHFSDVASADAELLDIFRYAIQQCSGTVHTIYRWHITFLANIVDSQVVFGLSDGLEQLLLPSVIQQRNGRWRNLRIVVAINMFKACSSNPNSIDYVISDCIISYVYPRVRSVTEIIKFI